MSKRQPDPDKEGQSEAHKKPEEPAESGENQGLPKEESIVEVRSFTSPKGRQYQILRTNQTDAYDEPEEQQS